jgi:hypothetical protein
MTALLPSSSNENDDEISSSTTINQSKIPHGGDRRRTTGSDLSAKNTFGVHSCGIETTKVMESSDSELSFS